MRLNWLDIIWSLYGSLKLTLSVYCNVLLCLYISQHTQEIFFFIIFILIKMPTNMKYDIQKLTFSYHFGIFTVSFSYFLFLSDIIERFLKQTKYFHQNFFYPRRISDKKNCSFSKRRSMFAIKKKEKRNLNCIWFWLNYKKLPILVSYNASKCK